MPVACASSNYNIIYLMKKVTLIIIGPKGAVNKSFHWAAYLDDIPTVWWYYPWSGKVSCHPFRRQCFDYYHDIKVSNLLHDHQFGTVIIWEIKNEKRFPHNYDDFMRVHNNAMKLRNRLVPKDLNEKKYSWTLHFWHKSIFLQRCMSCGCGYLCGLKIG